MTSKVKQILWESVRALAAGDEGIQERLAVAAGTRGGGLLQSVAARQFELGVLVRGENSSGGRENRSCPPIGAP